VAVVESNCISRVQAFQAQPIINHGHIHPVLGIPAVPKMEHIVLLAHSDPVQRPQDFQVDTAKNLHFLFVFMRIPGWPQKIPKK
jgi:hypothetical protein